MRRCPPASASPCSPRRRPPCSRSGCWCCWTGPRGARGTLPSSAPATASAGGAAGSGFDGAALPANVRAHEFTLTDQSGRPTTLGRYRGRVVVLAFLDSSCSACVLIAQQIRGALDELARPPAVLIMSVDPSADTPGPREPVPLAGVARAGAFTT